MVEYMKALPHLHEDAVPAFGKRAAERKPPLSQDMLNRERYALEEFFEQLKRVQQWLFNFGYPVPRARFLRIARSVAQSLVEFTSPTESTEEAVLRFQYEISELLYYWGAPRSKSAGA